MPAARRRCRAVEDRKVVVVRNDFHGVNVNFKFVVAIRVSRFLVVFCARATVHHDVFCRIDVDVRFAVRAVKSHVRLCAAFESVSRGHVSWTVLLAKSSLKQLGAVQESFGLEQWYAVCANGGV